MNPPVVVRVPASSANLGPGFDVFGMALDLYADVGVGPAPPGALAIDRHHPASIAHAAAGGNAVPLWARSTIPMARGLGFSGALRVGGAALACIEGSADPAAELQRRAADIVDVAADLEGHGDNVAASMSGGVVAWIDGRTTPLRVGPTLRAASVVVWIPDVTTSTDRSRATLPDRVERGDVVHNLARAAQLALAIERDDPDLLRGATADRIHQSVRLAAVPGAQDALDAGVEHGAWTGWLSGSGPTVAFLCADECVATVVGALPEGGHCKTLRIAARGAHVVDRP